MKYLALILSLSLLASGCISEETKNQNEENRKIFGQIVAYTDSIKIYSEPNDSSNIVAFLNFAESIERINFNEDYIKKSKGLGDSYFSEWLGAIHGNDTVWIKKQEEISTKYRIDTINNILILHYYGYCEYEGYGCYSRTKVINIRKNATLYNKYFNVKTTYQLNNSYYLLTPNGKVIVYDVINDSILYSTPGDLVKNSKNNSKLYFIRGRTTELVEYDYLNKNESILYKEPTDSTSACISFDDGELCSEIRVEEKDSLDNIYLTLYKMKENPRAEDDVYIYDIKVDNSGHLYYRDKR